MKRIDFLKTMGAFMLAIASWPARTVLRYNRAKVEKKGGVGTEAMFYRVIDDGKE